MDEWRDEGCERRSDRRVAKRADETSGDQFHRRQPMSYYESKDLERFREISQFRGELAEKFFDYYNTVTGEDGALTKREKALIALAVAHAKQCPYCIDAYTTQCLETGANPDEMTEAVHVAAVMEAGTTLVHGVQMHNALRKRGAM